MEYDRRFRQTSEEVPIANFGFAYSREEVFYNKIDDCFYVDNYLDGMVDDGDEKYRGAHVIDDADLWIRLCECGRDSQVANFLKFREVPNIDYIPEGISFEEFLEKLEELEAKYNCKLEKDVSAEEERIYIKISGTKYFFEVKKHEYFYSIKGDYSYCGALTFESAMKKSVSEISYRLSLIKSGEEINNRQAERYKIPQKSKKQNSTGLAVAVLVMYIMLLIYGVSNGSYYGVGLISVIVIILSAVIIREKKKNKNK